jgi:hypothetical protein
MNGWKKNNHLIINTNNAIFLQKVSQLNVKNKHFWDFFFGIGNFQS